MIKTVIVGGGNFPEIGYLKEEIKDAKYIIAADSGFDFLEKYKIDVDFLIGDFDSLSYDLNRIKIPEIIKFPEEKDLTDLHIAVEKAIDLNSNKIVIFGGTGTRLDHTITNVFLLKYIFDRGIDGKIIDNNNEIKIIKGKLEVYKSRFKYLSILPLQDNTIVSLKGTKYLLENRSISFYDSLCISNEIKEKIATVKVSDYSIIIQSKD